MRLSSVVLVVAGLLVAGACAGNRAKGLERPSDLGQEWVWGAEALPTGDVATSAITIEKFMPAHVAPDSVYAYTVRVTNVSKGTINDVVVSDEIPSGYTLINTEPEAQRNGVLLRWPVGPMGSGQSYTVRVTGHLEAGSEASSCASVAYVQPEQPKPGPTAAEAAAATAAAAAAADKAAADKAAAEKATADKAAAEKAAAEKATAEKAAADKAAAEKKAAADKAAADKAAADKVASDKAAADKAAAAAAGAAAGTAAGAAAGADKNAPTKTAAAAAKLDLSMSMPAEVCGFDEVSFKMLLRNTGKTKATEVRVVDQFPEGMTVNGKKYVAFNVGELAPGAGREFTVRMRASKTGKFRNTATVTAAGGLKSEASAETTIWKAAISVTGKASADSFGLGKEATFSFTVTNTGDRAAADSTLRVQFTGANSVTGASDGGTVSTNTVSWKLGSLAKGASKTVTVKAVRAAAGAVDCTATGAAKCADPVTAKAKGTFK